MNGSPTTCAAAAGGGASVASEMMSAELLRKVDALVESFVTNRKRSQLAGAYNRESMSTAAALEVADLMSEICSLYKQHNAGTDSAAVRMLVAMYPADCVATAEVQGLIDTINRAGEGILQSQFGTLLLMNVTRRVLAIVRRAAASNTRAAEVLESEARQRVSEYEQEEERRSSLPGHGHGGGGGDSSATPQLRHPSPSENSAGGGPHSPLTPRSGGGGGGGLGGMRSMASMQGRALSLSMEAMGGVGSVGGFGELRSPGLPPTQSRVAMALQGTQQLKRAGTSAAGFGSIAAATAAAAAVSGVGGSSVETELFPVKMSDFYNDVLKDISDYREEMHSMSDQLCARAALQIHATDTVVVLGCTNTARAYLCTAARASVGRPFKVIILEGAPSSTRATRRLARALRDAGIADVQVVPDSSAFAVMAVCTKALVSAEAVLANGGLLAPIGTQMLCLAARHFAVPALVATTMLKLSPFYPSDALCTRLVRVARAGAQSIPWSTYGASEDVLRLPYGPGALPTLSVHSPVTEYVAPEMVTLFATDHGEYVPSQIHRLVRERYSDVD